MYSGTVFEEYPEFDQGTLLIQALKWVAMP